MGGGTSRQKKVVTLILNPESSKSSVSKIHLDKKVTWSGLRKTIDTVFPELTGQPLTVTWHSPDKRTCKVSSDEELLVAVESMGDKTEFNIKRLKTGEDQTDKKDKDVPGRRISIKDNPTVARFVKPLAKIFSQKEMKVQDPLHKPANKHPDQQKTKSDSTKKQLEQNKSKTEEINKSTDQIKKQPQKK